MYDVGSFNVTWDIIGMSYQKVHSTLPEYGTSDARMAGGSAKTQKNVYCCKVNQLHITVVYRAVGDVIDLCNCSKEYLG